MSADRLKAVPYQLAKKEIAKSIRKSLRLCLRHRALSNHLSHSIRFARTNRIIQKLKWMRWRGKNVVLETIKSDWKWKRNSEGKKIIINLFQTDFVCLFHLDISAVAWLFIDRDQVIPSSSSTRSRAPNATCRKRKRVVFIFHFAFYSPEPHSQSDSP